MRHLFLNRRHLRVELQRPQTLELAEQLVVVVRHREDGVELLLEEELLLPLPMMITDLRLVVARPLAIPARALILLRVCRDVTVAKVLAFVLFWLLWASVATAMSATSTRSAKVKRISISNWTLMVYCHFYTHQSFFFLGDLGRCLPSQFFLFFRMCKETSFNYLIFVHFAY